ncbi:MAG TPA: M1 family metallopeptidase [Acidobacteriaceae bacterium]|nr:M1 family metallopeptidase [Acidobacteriaceae bacterium]
MLRRIDSSLSVRGLRVTLAALFSCGAMLLPAALEAQRLPDTARPEHYSLTLTPDLKSATFTGKESIDITLTQPSSTITLNAAEIKFTSVTADLAGKALTAKVTEDAAKQQATLDFGQQLPAGKLKLTIDYTGILNNELRGFYLSKTARRNYAVTQFESTDARRAFPSFDEPAFKATFDVTLVVDHGDTAISNTNIVRDEPDGAVKHAITFATTPKMSTYLLAFLVGDFKCLEGKSDGVPIRACATPDQVQYGAFALSAAEFVLHYYNTYFGIKYPMPKLDMIAIPDFEAGAMENFGAITYRESDLLLDTRHASVGAQRNVALVVAHEMAHQWFGDMVTMQWWDNTWLNEGFATWMENKPVAAWHPEWNVPEYVAADNQGTLDLDAQRVTRTIRAKAETPDEINEMFDGISYGKAGAMLLMVENYLGEETFRQGVHNYLAAHLYGNATAEDFWSAQTAASHKPVDKIMESLVAQPGEALLSFSNLQKGKSVSVAQQRFFLDPEAKAEGSQIWTLPVCMKTGDAQDCPVLAQASQQLSAPKAPFFFANAAGKGYYRTSYTPEMYHALLPHVENGLNSSERVSLLGDQWALMRAGKSEIATYLDLAHALRADTTPSVIASINSDLNSIYSRIAATDEEREALSKWTRTQFAPALKAIGEPAAEDAPEKRELRADLLTLVGGVGQDPAAIAEARAVTERSLANPEEADPTLFVAALAIAARNGDADLFDRVQQASEQAENPQQRASALHALALFRDPALEKRALDYIVSGKVRNQDSAGLIAQELASVYTRDLAWKYIQENWEKVSAQFTTFSGAYVVGATGNFCSADQLNDMTSFFASHKVAASERTLARAKDAIHGCIALRAAQGPNLKTWLAKQ